MNIAVTIYKERAPGMSFMRMPLFCWTSLCVSILIVFALPPPTVATAMLALDRYLDFHLFTNDPGGNVMNYANLFWLFGHPEVYILVLPAFGVYSEVFATFSGKHLFGYTALVIATMCIAVLSFTVWLHHFFTMGQSASLNAAFGVATMLIGIPTGAKIYDWLFTMYRGRVRLSVPMSYALGFLPLFAVGGATAVLWKRFWKAPDFALRGPSEGRDTMWDFLKNVALAGGFVLLAFGPGARDLDAFLDAPFASSRPYASEVPRAAKPPGVPVRVMRRAHAEGGPA